MLESSSSAANLPQKNVYIPAINGSSPSSSRTEPIANQEYSHWLNFNSNNAENCMIAFHLIMLTTFFAYF
ncbi:hypothetical protein Lalb_Chr13g0294441 [Lupinus albus]|uniref:Uncharacterized protein n=1 Tax=Lupinus albus TaxID=3870 RepID=A0A6A4PID3_LUPAL|nr:hypothetical protein Lalb_Chr13g0294441 [Lupinus albus]